jgi:DNA-binding NtrC family response regulator
MKKAFSTVLVVEDDPMIQRLLEGFLAELGIGSETASSVTKAAEVARLKGDLIDAAVIDLDLPDGSGFELACKLRLDRPKLPVIIATGYTRAAIPSAAGPRFGYIKKPYDLEMLREALADVASR